MNRIWVRRPILLLVLLIALLLRDHSGTVRLALLVSVLHESGHVLAYWCIRRQLPVLTLSAAGIGLRYSCGLEQHPGQLAVVAAAGPAVNLLLCAAALVWMQYRACYWGYFFAGANLCAGLFNLLPLGPLDGKRLLQALRRS